jgi:hypothetical protein
MIHMMIKYMTTQRAMKDSTRGMMLMLGKKRNVWATIVQIACKPLRCCRSQDRSKEKSVPPIEEQSR